MANAQAPAAVQQQQQQQNNMQNEEANATNAEDTLTPITKLLRYLYTGTTTSSIPVKSTTAPDLHDIQNTLACIMTLAEAQPNLPISKIRMVSFFFLFIQMK